MNNLPNISFVGRSISRREDKRLLTGRGQFIADLKLPRSSTVTSAPIPEATCAAFVPATPPPRTTTVAAATPGAPASNTPRPFF
jgi:CO/xanthine dehydrogenase Mo-binding subunit